MFGTDGRGPYCKRCGSDLEDGQEACPECGYNPRQKGIKVAMGFLLLFVISMTLIIALLKVDPKVTPYLLPPAMGFLALAMITYFVSLLATPYRLGALFDLF